ncbi:MAG: hypothetical protein J0G30_04110 [Actinomycetales bacterium]|nr:hypothetical protein [Actinomycetales bacterium]
MSNLKLPGDDQRDRGRVTPARIAIWIIVGGIGLYLVITGLVGVATSGG